MQLSFTTNFKDTEVMLQRMEAQLPVKQRELLDALTPRFIAIQEESLRNATPEGRGWDEFSTSPERDAPRLADTTKSDTIRQGSNQFQSVALIQTYQTKGVIGKDGQTIELSDLLVKGRQGPAQTIRPLIRTALYWTGANHPVGSSPGGPAAPNDYFQKARDDALPKIEAAAAAGVASMAESLFTLR